MIIVPIIHQFQKHIPQLVRESGALLNPIDEYQSTPDELQQSQDDSGNLNKAYDSCPVLFVEQRVMLSLFLVKNQSPT